MGKTSVGGRVLVNQKKCWGLGRDYRLGTFKQQYEMQPSEVNWRDAH